MICTFAVGSHRELAAISAAASRAYARRWGWDVVATSEPHLPHGRPASWAKIPLLIELLGRYEWVWWIDADALIVDLGRDVMAEIDPAEGPLWLASHPQGTPSHGVVENAGVMLARSSPEVLDFLRTVWAHTEFTHHNWWENAAILDLLGRSLDAPYPRVRDSMHAGLISALSVDWNTVPGYVDSPSAALHHHARADHDSFDRRVASMRADLARAADFPVGGCS